MIKNFLFFVAMAALFLISCSDGDKFSMSSKLELELPDIKCGKTPNELYVGAYADGTPTNTEYYYFYWIIDGKLISNSYNKLSVQERVSYGEHIIEFVLIDSFEDTLSKSCYVSTYKVTLLSPVDKYKAEQNDTIKFQYKISGIDTWQENPPEVYISTDKENWKQIDSILPPPFADTVYWRVKAFTEQDTAFSEIRSILWIKD